MSKLEGMEEAHKELDAAIDKAGADEEPEAIEESSITEVLQKIKDGPVLQKALGLTHSYWACMVIGGRGEEVAGMGEAGGKCSSTESWP